MHSRIGPDLYKHRAPKMSMNLLSHPIYPYLCPMPNQELIHYIETEIIPATKPSTRHIARTTCGA